jgi:glycosyltransferase involved in cell wall biosynthesis
LVTEGAGWWIEHGVQPLVDSLREAMAMADETRRQMGEHGRSWMQRDFAWPALGEKLAQTYSWLLDRERPKPDFVRLD